MEGSKNERMQKVVEHCEEDRGRKFVLMNRIVVSVWLWLYDTLVFKRRNKDRRLAERHRVGDWVYGGLHRVRRINDGCQSIERSGRGVCEMILYFQMRV